MLILALDLGLSCGWCCARAIGRGVEIAGSGTWDLRAISDDNARRFASLRTSLLVALRDVRYDLLAFEDVPASAHSGGDAAHVWGALHGVALTCCAETGTRYLGVGIATWKRAAGLRSHSNAAAALAAARRRWPGVDFAAEDEAVARWVAVAAQRMTAERRR